MNVVDNDILAATAIKAETSPRKRENYDLHKPKDYLQRILQVAKKGSYYPPHKHPEKLEFFMAIQGKLAVIIFDDDGTIRELTILGKDSIMAEIPAGSWHTVVVLSPNVSFIEVIAGYYDPATHKIFAPWAPTEDSERAAQYLKKLIRELKISRK